MVVRLLDAVEYGAAHERNASRVLGDVGVAFDPSDGHREVQGYPVARSPGAAYLHVRARKDPGGHRFAVDFDSSVLLTPGWEAEHQGELTLAPDFYPSIPRVAGALAEPDGPCPGKFNVRCALGVEMNPDGVFRSTIEVAGQRGQEAGNVWRAAGATEPGPAPVGAIVGEGVLIEVVLAVEGYARHDSVVEGVFDQVRKPGVAFDPEHAPVPHHAADGGTGLRIGSLVGQLEVLTERLALIARAETATNVHATCGHVHPQPPQGFHEFKLTRLGVHVRGAGVEIHGTYGVAHDLALVAKWLVVLAVGRVVLLVGTSEQAVPAGVDEVPRRLQVPLLTRDPVQFDEGHLDLFVAVDGLAFSLFRPEGITDMVGEARGHVQETLRSVSPEVGDCGLEEMACAVHLVQVEVGPALGGSLEREVRVQVSVRPLGVLYLGYGVVDHPLQVGVRVGGERPGRRFEPLVHVRIVEIDPLILAADLARGATEVVQAAGLFEVPVLRRQRDLSIDTSPGLPEVVGEAHGL